MKVMVCLDDDNGMLFNGRRQSRDRLLREDMINLLQGARLWMNEYSAKQFEEGPEESIIADEKFLEKANENDYCFVEDRKLLLYEPAIRELILYRWNRKYPADMFFDIDLSHWELVNRTEFPGSSHVKITKEIYRPKHMG